MNSDSDAELNSKLWFKVLAKYVMTLNLEIYMRVDYVFESRFSAGKI